MKFLGDSCKKVKILLLICSDSEWEFIAILVKHCLSGLLDSYSTCGYEKLQQSIFVWKENFFINSFWYAAKVFWVLVKKKAGLFQIFSKCPDDQFDEKWYFRKIDKLLSIWTWAKSFELLTKKIKHGYQNCILLSRATFWGNIFLARKKIFVTLWNFVERKFGSLLKTWFYRQEDVFQVKHLSYRQKKVSWTFSDSERELIGFLLKKSWLVR